MNELNEAQKRAVSHQDGPLLMAAGAGSGKTKALTSRLKALIDRGVPAEKILAITFTNKAADEMRKRVFGIDAKKPPFNAPLPLPGTPFIGTFHSLGARILKQELKHTGRKNGFSIFDADDALRLITRLIKEAGIPKETFKPRMVLHYISKIKSEMIKPESLFNSAQSRDQIMLTLYERYQHALAENNAFDFDDLISVPVTLLEANKDVREKYQNAFQHVLVDEYQDINTSQYQLVRLLASKHNNISVVGDDAQAIYSFRGANFKNFLNFERDWPNATVVKLEQNYRSTKNIISAANALIGHNKLQKQKNLWTENEEGALIKLVATEDPETEAVWLSSEIQMIREADPRASIAVIYRINAQSRSVEQSLISENIPYLVYGGLKFYERKEIKDLVAGLRLALNPLDTMSKDRLAKAFGKRLSNDIIARLPQHAATESPAQILNFLLTATDYRSYLEHKFQNPQERYENVAELLAFAAQFDSLESLMERVSLLQATDDESVQDQETQKKKAPVNLMTIHIAKGLEFDYVFIVGVNEGVMPHEKSLKGFEEIEEERRLMYVAMTRARRKLYILFHAVPSRFLYEIPTGLCEFISPTGTWSALPSDDDMWLEQ